ncbi:hypothetical protein BYT27DRAFT_7192612 [Phlegmacium glaucopus]|nr:hypothetical protein BYT27DRAFT_7192612 [Phlegmacium glaucopus]
MVTTCPTTIVPPAADSTSRRTRGVPVPTRRSHQRMIYGFTFSSEELVDWGQQHFDNVEDNEQASERYIRKSMGPLFTRCFRLWRRTTKHFVTYSRGPRRHEEDWCLTLADNISRDTATPPPREVIDNIKNALEITRDPAWHRFYGD